MKIIDCQQGSPEWHRARIGLPTASAFSQLVTPKTGKPSASAEAYCYKLCAEWLLGVPMDAGASDFMERGSDLERQAVAWYEFVREVETREVGFCMADDGSCGCSPDRLVGDDGGLEIKCPSAHVHIGHLLGAFDEKHRPQVQGCMWITGRSWWDVLSFHPRMPQALVRVERDEDYIALLAEGVTLLRDRMRDAKARLLDMGCEPMTDELRQELADEVMFGSPAPRRGPVMEMPA